MNGKRSFGILLDLDGTIYHGSRMIPHADQLIALLKQLSVPYQFLTNNSAATPEDVAGRLNAMGVQAEPRDVCTSAQAAAHFIASNKAWRRIHIVGEHGLRHAIAEAGLAITEDTADVVLQGIDRQATYRQLGHAAALIRGGAQYILTNPDLLVPAEEGLIPGAGSISAMLQAASGQQPLVIGKPSPIFTQFALDRLGTAPGDTWVVGDNLATDIAAGLNAGCKAVLVLTGLATRANLAEQLAQAGCEPNRVIDDLAELMAHITRHVRGYKEPNEQEEG